MQHTLLDRDWPPPPEPPAAWLAENRGALPPALLRVLWTRGCRSPQAIADLLSPPPLPPLDTLPDLPRAVERLRAARRAGEMVLVAGDYDADGVCSAALALEGLRALGLRVTVHLPTRAEGYGLQARTLPERVDACGARVVLAVDNGSTAHGAIETVRASGVDVLVCDHHQLGDTPPAALALINPLRDPDGPFQPLAGVGVTWCLVQALGAAMGQAPPPAEDLVAVGTIADVAPLVGINRTLVRKGLAAMAERTRPGLAALQEQLRVPPRQAPSARDISHGMAPRLNAPGRMGDPRPALDLLLARDAPRAMAALAVLDEVNTRRREAAARVLDGATRRAQEDGAPVVLADPDWPAGLVGPAAAVLCERLGVPVLLAHRDAEDVCRGSGRAPDGWDLGAALQACGELLLRGGGHARAAGFEVEHAHLEDLRRALAEAAPAAAPPPAWSLDGVLDPDEVALELGLATERLGPFGDGHTAPTFLLREVRWEEPRRMGEDGRHLRGRLRLPGARGAQPAVAFGLGDWAEGLAAGGPWDVAVQPGVNRFRGREGLELSIVDAAPTDGDWGRFVRAARAGLDLRHPDRDAMARVFRRLEALGRSGPLPAEAVLVAHLAPACLAGEEAARAAVRILRELDLVDAQGRIRRPADGKKRQLAESPRYRAAEAARAVLTRLEGQAVG